MRKLSKRVIITFIIAILLTIMIPVLPVHAVEAYADADLVTSVSTATWVTDDYYGDVVELDSVATAGASEYAIVRIDVDTDITLGTIAANLPTFMYNISVLADAENMMALEMYFEDADTDGYVEISIFPYTSAVKWDDTLDIWQEATGHSGATYGVAYGEDNASAGISIATGNNPLTSVLTDLYALNTVNSTWELTRVGVQLGWVGITDMTVRVDYIDVDGVTYDLTNYAEGEGFSIDYVTPGNVDYGDVLTVIGSTVTSGSTVNVYWDIVSAANLLNYTTGLPSGDYELTVKVPSAKIGDHYLWVKDLASGISKRSDAIPVIPKITLSPDAGLEDDDVIIKGYGFTASSDVTFTYGGLSTDTGDDETDALGYFEYEFEVDATSDGDYTVTATDDEAESDSATFTVGAALTLDVSAGPAGTVVKVEGRGFTPSTIIRSKNNITLDGTVPVSTKDGNNVTASGTGTFTLYVVIPSVEEGDYDIEIDDGAGKDADASFEVNGETSITVTPSYGTPGTVLTIKGYNFTRISGTDVDLALKDAEAEATTDASGSFTATITIPPLDFGESYAVTANDTRLCHAEDDVLVALMVLQLSEYSGPVGAKVMLMGSGLTLDGDWNATFGDMGLIETTSTSSGTTYFSEDFWVPSVPSGTYTIGVYDVDREITVNIDFTVTDQAALTVSRASVPNGYNLTLEGVNFAEEDATISEWWIYNSTEAWLLDDNVTQGPQVLPVSPVPVTDEDGVILAWYEIPAFLELGSYTINCTTVSNAPSGEDWVINQTAEVTIELVPEEVVLNVGNPSYARGQTITFVIKATLEKDPFYLGIKDPSGSEVFNTTWDTTVQGAPESYWGTIGDWFYIPSNRQIDTAIGNTYTIPSDAEAGTWTYYFWDDDMDYANGTFQVTELTEIEQLQEDIGAIVSSVLDLGTSITDIGTAVADVSGAAADAATAAASAAAAAVDAKAAANSAAAAISDVDETASAALDAANDAKSAADAAKTAADSGLAAANDAKATAQTAADAANDAADAAEGAKTAATGLTTLVYGAIGASLIAALAAIVSLMQISRRIAG